MNQLLSPLAPRAKRIIAAIVAIYALCPSLSVAAGLDAGRLASGCTSCHGTAGESVGAIPSLAGQDRDVLASRLAVFKAQSTDSTIMNRIAIAYSDAELQALADYFSKVKP